MNGRSGGNDYRITLVIDESCGSQLDELVRMSYVWAIESPENDRCAAQHWHASSPPSDPLPLGLTIPRPVSQSLLLQHIVN